MVCYGLINQNNTDTTKQKCCHFKEFVHSITDEVINNTAVSRSKVLD